MKKCIQQHLKRWCLFQIHSSNNGVKRNFFIIVGEQTFEKSWLGVETSKKLMRVRNLRRAAANLISLTRERTKFLETFKNFLANCKLPPKSYFRNIENIGSNSIKFKVGTYYILYYLSITSSLKYRY